MTFELTERDKKLLVVLAVVVIIAGVGFGILYPLVTKARTLNEQLDAAQYEKQEKVTKIGLLPQLKIAEQELTDSLHQLQEEFYEPMTSMDVDKMLTKRAISCGLTSNDLSISMPGAEEPVQIEDYPQMIQKLFDTSTADPSTYTYAGISTINVTMTMTGTRDNLQKMLDDCIADGPKMRVVSFNWQTSALVENQENLGMTITMELYMYQDMDAYIQYLQDQAAVENGTASEETTVETESLE